MTLVIALALLVFALSVVFLVGHRIGRHVGHREGSAKAREEFLTRTVHSFPQMQYPLRRRLDMNAIGRSMLAVEPLPPGAVPNYFRDTDDKPSIPHVVIRDAETTHAYNDTDDK